MEIIFN